MCANLPCDLTSLEGFDKQLTILSSTQLLFPKIAEGGLRGGGKREIETKVAFSLLKG